MSAQPHDFRDVPAHIPEKNLRAIRAALTVPEDREAFDAELQATLNEVRVSLDLSVLTDFVHRWWITAVDAERDPEGRRRMYDTVAHITATGQTPTGRPWRDVLGA